MPLWYFILLLTLWSWPNIYAQFEVPAAPDGYILDQANVLSPSFKEETYRKLVQLQSQNSSQIAIVTLDTLDEYPLEMAAIQIARDWWIGQRDSDNGILLLLVIRDRDVRIEVWRWLEWVVTDAEASSIIHTRMIPLLREENYDGAVWVAVDRMIALAKWEAFPVVQGDNSFGFWEMVYIFVILSLGFGWWVMSLLSSTKSWWLGGIFGGVIGSIMMWMVVTWWYGLILGAILGLLLDYILSTYFFGKEYFKMQSRSWWRWWGRGGWGWGFGWFGGGGFGGWGSSGSW